MTEVSLSPDGSTITVFVPMAWRRRGGRKVIVAPPGSDAWAPPPKIDSVLLKALARAHRWRRLLEEGRFCTLAELADAERISRSYVCRVLRLTLLAPDIVERILDGRPTAGLAQLMKPFPVEWERQRNRLL
jgi:ParB-like chromosome segregation protein Spo0J